MTSRSIEHLKKRFVEDGFEAALKRKPREKPPREVIFDGAFEARLIALACSDAPVLTKIGNIYKILAENIPESIPKSKRPFDIKALRLNFRNDFKEFVSENQSKLRIKKVYPEHWLDIHFVHPRCHICMTINTKRDLMTCELYLPDSKNFSKSF